MTTTKPQHSPDHRIGAMRQRITGSASQAEQDAYRLQTQELMRVGSELTACRIDRDRLAAENARQAEQIRRLREALNKIATLQNGDVADLRDGSVIIRNRTAALARAALAE